MDGVELFGKCLAQATYVVKQVRPEHFSNTTPDTEWNVRDLVGHMLNELSWVPDLLQGATIDEVGDKYDGDLIGESDIDLSVHWQAAADKAEAAINEADLEEMAHLSYGDLSNDDYLREAGGDQLIHAWDLGSAIGVPVKIDPDLARAVYENTLPNETTMRGSGLFGPSVDVPVDSDIQTKLLALFGRRADWRPGA